MIVFDLDGTLVDSAPEIVAAMEQAWSTLEKAPFPRERFRIGPPLMDIMRDLGAADPAAVATAFRARYDASDFSGSPPFAGVVDLVAELQRRAPIAVATNKRAAPAHKILKRWFPERFARIATIDLIDAVPGTYSKADMLRTLGAAVLVGDTVGDIRSAREAGVRIVAVTWGYDTAETLEKAGPDALVSDPSALLEALSQGGK